MDPNQPHKIDSLKRLAAQVTLAQTLAIQHPAAARNLISAARLYRQAIKEITADRLSELTEQSSSNIEDELTALADLSADPLLVLQAKITQL